MHKIHYLDNAATTALYPDLIETLKKYYLDVFANPSSLHKAGLDAEKSISNSRKLISKLIGSEENQIIFTCGATEANNIVIQNFASQYPAKPVITTKIEHSSVKKTIQHFFADNVYYLENDSNGIINDNFSDEKIKQASLMSIILVNNEIATIQDIKSILEKARKNGFSGHVHVDATQGVGKIDIDVKDLDCDFLTASAHKFKAPKGVGFLYCKNANKLSSLFLGGSQEFSLRAGTQNVAGICAMAKALSKSCSEMSSNAIKVKKYKDKIKNYIKHSEYFDLTISENTKQSPYILSIKSNLAPSEVLLHAYADYGVYLSSGSACNSSNPSISSVLGAIGSAPANNTAVLRVSFASDTVEDDIDAFIDVSNKLVERFAK